MTRKLICRYFCLLASMLSFQTMAIDPELVVVRNINFGTILPVVGSCRMIASTGAVSSYAGQYICLLTDSAQNGLYTIMANANKNIRVKVLPNLDNGDGYVFNPFIEIVSQGQATQVISNNIGFKSINSGADGLVNLYIGGDFVLNTSLANGQTIEFNFIDAIEWYEDP